jgi:hypothetical protein
MPTVEETLKAMQERIAQLEKQVEEGKQKAKRKRIIKIESDGDYDVSFTFIQKYFCIDGVDLRLSTAEC